MLESRVERRLVQEFKKHNIELLKFKTPSRRDVPDRIAFLDNAVVILIEVKRPGEMPRKKQILYMKRLVKLGHYVFVIDHTRLIDELIAEATALPKRSSKIRTASSIRWFVYRDGAG